MPPVSLWVITLTPAPYDSAKRRQMIRQIPKSEWYPKWYPDRIQSARAGTVNVGDL